MLTLKKFVVILFVSLFFSGCSIPLDINMPGDNSNTTVPSAEIEQVIQPGPMKGKDAYVYNYTKSYNYGSEETIKIGDYGLTEKLYRSYLQFDLSSIPSNALIIEAKLGLYLYSRPSSLCPGISAHQVKGYWEEDEISWKYQPAFSETPTDINEWPCVSNKFHYWDLTDLVNGWVGGSIENYGVMLKSYTGGNEYSFRSSEYTSPNPRPKLVIKYYSPGI